VAPSTRVVAFKGKELTHGLRSFVAPTASIVGDVTLGERSSVWYGASVRGDGASVSVGTNSSVQDGASLSTERKQPGVVVGSGVVVGA
jgi:carbonic anhydrase/acetyltransferase-like protein (isoleucine patch superfamily)